MDVESLTARLAGRFGPRIAEWCAAVPELLAQLASRWGLVLGGPLPDGASSPRLLRGRMEEAFARVGRRLAEPAIAARMDAATWDRALRRCERLLDTETATVLLHGDLHPGNVLDGGPRRGLVAIDPKACAGDPCFDAVDFVVAGAGREGVEARCAGVAAAYGLDPDRLYAWSRVDAAFAALARLGAGEEGPAVEELLALTR